MTRTEFNMKELEYDELKKENTFFDSNDVNSFLNDVEDKIKELIEDLVNIKSIRDLYVIEDVLEELKKLGKALY